MSTKNNNKISNISYQKVFQNICRKRPVLKSLFNTGSGLQPVVLPIKRLQYKCFLVKLLRTRFLSNISWRLLLEEHKILLKTVSIAIPIDISRAYYQKGFAFFYFFNFYFLFYFYFFEIHAHGRFMEFVTETYSKCFPCSWIFSTSWASPNA